MRVTGQPKIVKDSGATMVWDGDYLPGLWLVNQAIETAMPRAAHHGVVTVAIRKSHHIGCLAALVKQAADKGFIAIIANSDPAGKRVAPYGGTEPLFTPNPFAVGYPGRRSSGARRHLRIDHDGVDDAPEIRGGRIVRAPVAARCAGRADARSGRARKPAAARARIQLMGGQEYGHKGFGLALMIEALSQGLSGHGRSDDPKRWGGNVFLQVLDPEFFAGRDAFAEQMDFLAERSRANRPIRADRPVRLPGDQAAQSIEAARKQGIAYDDATWAASRMRDGKRVFRHLRAPVLDLDAIAGASRHVFLPDLRAFGGQPPSPRAASTSVRSRTDLDRESEHRWHHVLSCR